MGAPHLGRLPSPTKPPHRETRSDFCVNSVPHRLWRFCLPRSNFRIGDHTRDLELSTKPRSRIRHSLFFPMGCHPEAQPKDLLQRGVILRRSRRICSCLCSCSSAVHPILRSQVIGRFAVIPIPAQIAPGWIDRFNQRDLESGTAYSFQWGVILRRSRRICSCLSFWLASSPSIPFPDQWLFLCPDGAQTR